jgi:hypothetical protein
MKGSVVMIVVLVMASFFLVSVAAAAEKSKMETATGKVTAVDPQGKAITISAKAGKEAMDVGTIVDKDTMVKVKGKAAILQDLKVGDGLALALHERFYCPAGKCQWPQANHSTCDSFLLAVERIPLSKPSLASTCLLLTDPFVLSSAPVVHHINRIGEGDVGPEKKARANADNDGGFRSGPFQAFRHPRGSLPTQSRLSYNRNVYKPFNVIDEIDRRREQLMATLSQGSPKK